MSQIIKKYQTGGSSPIKLFSSPYGEIETDRLVKAISLNLDDYLSRLDWSLRRKDKFLRSIDNFITGIKNGNITGMTATGLFRDSRGEEGGGVSDSNGNIFFRPDRQGATYIKWVLQGQDPYQDPSKLKKEGENKSSEIPYDINRSFARAVNKEYFNTDSDQFDESQMHSLYTRYGDNWFNQLTNTISNLNMDNWGIYGNRDNYLREVQEMKDYLSGIENPTTELYKASLMSLGINPNFVDYITRTKSTVNSALNLDSGQTQLNQQQESTLDSILDLQQLLDLNQQLLNNPLLSTGSIVNKSLKDILDNPGAREEYKKMRWYSLNLDYGKPYFSTMSRYFALNPSTEDGYVQSLLNIMITNPINKYNDVKVNMPVDDNRMGSRALFYAVLLMLAREMYKIHNNQASKVLEKMGNTNTYIIKNSINFADTGKTYSMAFVDLGNGKGKLIYLPTFSLTNLNDEIINQALEALRQKHNRLINSRKNGGVLKYLTGGRYWNDLWSGQDSFNTDWSLFIPVTGVSSEQSNVGKVVQSDLYSLPTSLRLKSSLDAIKQGRAGVDDINMMLRRHSGLWKTYNSKWSPVYNLETANYLTDFNNQGFNTSIILPGYANNYVMESGKPISGDSQAQGWKSDGYYDAITDDRRVLARRGDYTGPDDPRLLADILTAKDAGYRYYLDDLSGYYMLEPLNPESPAQPQQKPSAVILDEVLDGSVASATNPSEKDPVKNDLGYWGLPVASSILRYLNIADTNRLMRDLAMDLKPYYKLPKRFERNVYGDYGALSTALLNAANLNNQASRPLTSDGSLQTASQLEGQRLANQEIAKGNLANTLTLRLTQELALAQDRQNMEWLVDTANENRYNVWNTDTIKNQEQRGYLSRRGLNFDNFIKELQMIGQQRRDLAINLKRRAIDLYIASKYGDNSLYRSLQEGAARWVAEGNDIRTYPQYLLLMDLGKQMAREQTELSLKYLGRLYGVGNSTDILNYVGDTSYSPIKVDQVPTNKKGGTITTKINTKKINILKHKLEEQKVFQKNIEAAVKDNSEMLRSLGNTMLKLLLKIKK